MSDSDNPRIGVDFEKRVRDCFRKNRHSHGKKENKDRHI